MASFLSQPGNTPQAFFAIGRSAVAIGPCDKEYLISKLAARPAAESEVRTAVSSCCATGILRDDPIGVRVAVDWESVFSEDASPSDFAMAIAERAQPGVSGLSAIYDLVLAVLGGTDAVLRQRTWPQVLKQSFENRALWPITDNEEQTRSALRWLEFLGCVRRFGDVWVPDCARWMARWLNHYRDGAPWSCSFAHWWRDVVIGFPALGAQDTSAQSVQLTLLILEKRGILRFSESSDAKGGNIDLGLLGELRRAVNTVEHVRRKLQ